jgi:hypothetical protein
MTTDNFCFYLPNRLIQTSQTGGQWYTDTSPFSIPWIEFEDLKVNIIENQHEMTFQSIRPGTNAINLFTTVNYEFL